MSVVEITYFSFKGPSPTLRSITAGVRLTGPTRSLTPSSLQVRLQLHFPPLSRSSPPASARSACSAGEGSGALKRSLEHKNRGNMEGRREATFLFAPSCCSA